MYPDKYPLREGLPRMRSPSSSRERPWIGSCSGARAISKEFTCEGAGGILAQEGVVMAGKHGLGEVKFATILGISKVRGDYPSLTMSIPRLGQAYLAQVTPASI